METTQSRFEILFAFHSAGLPMELLDLWSLKDLAEYMDFYTDKISRKKPRKRYSEGNLAKIL